MQLNCSEHYSLLVSFTEVLGNSVCVTNSNKLTPTEKGKIFPSACSLYLYKGGTCSSSRLPAFFPFVSKWQGILKCRAVQQQVCDTRFGEGLQMPGEISSAPRAALNDQQWSCRHSMRAALEEFPWAPHQQCAETPSLRLEKTLRSCSPTTAQPS